VSTVRSMTKTTVSGKTLTMMTMAMMTIWTAVIRCRACCHNWLAKVGVHEWTSNCTAS